MYILLGSVAVRAGLARGMASRRSNAALLPHDCGQTCYSSRGKGAEYSDEHVCMPVCVCMYVSKLLVPVCQHAYLRNRMYHLHQIF